MTTFLTRNAARAVRSTVNAKAKEAGSLATFREPVKDADGLWTLPSLKHSGKTLTLKRG